MVGRLGGSVLELTPVQVAALEKLHSRGFQFVAFPLYASYVGVRKGNCATLLAPVEGGGMRVYGEPCFLVDGNLSVRVKRQEQVLYVWKQKSLAATPEREDELKRFSAEVRELLGA
jgi:hypothetical protein